MFGVARVSNPAEIMFSQTLPCEQALPRAEMRSCNNHEGKSINAHLISIHIIYKPNQSYSSGSFGENASYKVQSKNVNITLSIFTWSNKHVLEKPDCNVNFKMQLGSSKYL